ncbi:UDP-glucose 4-epimerase GalE [Caulobacter flavus]|uniref:UDP-glucose 4-epimerase n=1 Tax=Caulobacter flavus TaxID=1679497 RepID=A0A2N5CSL1_9CAUL|nr:UDP-glucose 4-epimerase GalE [Caulobacter flavus]AYV45613.1 UDP-glucose 4-epimerase GalE [Caulobacter flavus]PLR13858.1 UDP-glucose 4-epimerase GalE [Caulobacter flavus]
MSQAILVAGGAGYIGSHTCLRLAEAGFTPVVYDNLSNGWEEFVQWGPLEVGDVNDPVRLAEVFAKHKPAAVIHFAAFVEVAFSIAEPGAFYGTNVGGAITLIEAARKAGVDKLVFSSTCATYGPPVTLPMDETHPQAPLNPYGRSKLMVEQILRDMDRYKRFHSVVLRYFNAAGADPEGRIGEKHEPETHAIPLAIAAARGEREKFTLYGSDYDTRDGTCIRDYVHVLDLADAHVLALKWLLDGKHSTAFNLGTGEGTSVRELVAAIERRSNRNFPLETVTRRDGDAPILVADSDKARALLGWNPRYGLDDIIQHAWAWHANGATALKR